MIVRHETVWRGDRIEIPFVYTESQGSPAPILRFTLAASRNNSTKLHEQDLEHVEDDPLAYQAVLTGSDTGALEPGTYYWDFKWVAAEQTVAIGTLKVKATVYRP